MTTELDPMECAALEALVEEEVDYRTVLKDDTVQEFLLDSLCKQLKVHDFPVFRTVADPTDPGSPERIEIGPCHRCGAVPPMPPSDVKLTIRSERTRSGFQRMQVCEVTKAR